MAQQIGAPSTELILSEGDEEEEGTPMETGEKEDKPGKQVIVPKAFSRTAGSPHKVAHHQLKQDAKAATIKEGKVKTKDHKTDATP